MNEKGDIDRVWDIVEKVGVCMGAIWAIRIQ
jgi:hypothetical protein